MVSIHCFRRAVSDGSNFNASIEGEQKTLRLQENIVKLVSWVTPDSLCTCTVWFKLFPFLWIRDSKLLLPHLPAERSESLTKLISRLGSTDSGSNNVRLKPFSASIFKFFIWIIATVTKIYTKGDFKPDHSGSFLSPSRTFTRSNIKIHTIAICSPSLRFCLNGGVSIVGLSAIDFRG